MRYRGILREPGPGIGRGLGPSILLHAVLFLVLMVGYGHHGPERPPIERDAFLVSAVTLQKAEGLPTKAAAPRPKKSGEAGKVKVLRPEPVRPDQRVLKEKAQADAGEKKAPNEKEEEKSRADHLAHLEEEKDEVVFETSAEGSEEADPREALRARFGRELTAYQRLVRDAIQRNWFPRGSSGKPGDENWAVITFTLTEGGQIGDPFVEAQSGDFVYDQSCLRAVTRTATVPPPPSNEPRTMSVSFSPKDKT